MTATQAPGQPTSQNSAPSKVPAKVAAAAAAVLGVSLFWTVAVIDVPHEASDQELVRWWQDAGNRWAGVISGMCAVLVAVSVAALVAHLQHLDEARRSRRWLSFARSMAGGVTAMWLVTGAVRATPGHLVDVMHEPLPRTDVLRVVTALNYTLLGLAGMAVLGLFILAVSVVVLRTAVLGRWLGYVGAGCAALMLVSVVAQYGAYTTLLAVVWACCVAVALWRGQNLAMRDTDRAPSRR